MPSANGFSSFVVLLVLLVLLVPLFGKFSSSVGSIVQLVCQFCWFSSPAGSLVLLVHQLCWFACSAGCLVLLVCQLCCFTSPFGSLVLLVDIDLVVQLSGLVDFFQSLYTIFRASAAGFLVLVVYWCCWVGSPFGSLVLLVDLILVVGLSGLINVYQQLYTIFGASPLSSLFF